MHSTTASSSLSHKGEGYTLTVTRKVPLQLLKDILTTAAEGGINYWLAQAQRVVRDEDLNVLRIVGPLDLGGEEISTALGATDSKGKWKGSIELDTVMTGIALLASSQEIVGLGHATRARIVGAVLGDPDDFFVGEDADTADIIVQLGLFGEVVFG